jgi:hypothetical protein
MWRKTEKFIKPDISILYILQYTLPNTQRKAMSTNCGNCTRTTWKTSEKLRMIMKRRIISEASLFLHTATDIIQEFVTNEINRMTPNTDPQTHAAFLISSTASSDILCEGLWNVEFSIAALYKTYCSQLENAVSVIFAGNNAFTTTSDSRELLLITKMFSSFRIDRNDWRRLSVTLEAVFSLSLFNGQLIHELGSLTDDQFPGYWRYLILFIKYKSSTKNRID